LCFQALQPWSWRRAKFGVDAAARLVDAEPMTGRSSWLHPTLTWRRVAFALGVAVVADVGQIMLGPVGWLFPDEAIDVIAMVATTLALGFHPLLLPTFVLEFLPVTDLWPTWTTCVVAVVALRRNELRTQPTQAPQHPDIDVRPTNVR
jgi:hypothetical protein